MLLTTLQCLSFIATKNTDVTELSVQDKKLYLSPVIDLVNREIMTNSLSEEMEMVNTLMHSCYTLNKAGRIAINKQ